MRAAVTVRPRSISIQELPTPCGGATEALISVESVGLCGSDYELYSGSGWAAPFPLIQGHEFAGRIAALGAGYDGSLVLGDRVAVDPVVACGTCYACRHGRYNCCADLHVLGWNLPGALAEFVAVPVDHLYPTPDLAAELAALVEPMTIGLQAVRRGCIGEGDRVAIFGAGPIGLAVLLGARDAGAETLVIDRLESRLDLATQFGASSVARGDDDIKSVVAEWTSGEGSGAAIDATGSPSAIRMATEVVVNSGRVVIVGISQEEVSLPVGLFTRKELNVFGSVNGTGLFGEAVELVRKYQDLLCSLVTHRFALDDAAAGIEFAASRPAGAEKIMIKPSG